MKHNRKTTLSLVAALAVGVAIASPVYAGGNHGGQAGQFGHGEMMGSQGGQFGHGEMMGGQGGQFGHGGNMGSQGGMMGGQGDMRQMMMQMHGQMNAGQGGMMGGHGGAGMMGGGQMGGIGFMSDLDADGDGTVTPEEARAGLQTMLEEFDTDGDDTLSLSEFEALHSAAIREQMVDRFQMLDNDGDGQVTTDEITAPAERMEGMMDFRAGQMGPQGVFGGMGMGAGNGTMMQNQGN